jgi:hypothetical protein
MSRPTGGKPTEQSNRPATTDERDGVRFCFENEQRVFHGSRRVIEWPAISLY